MKKTQLCVIGNASKKAASICRKLRSRIRAEGATSPEAAGRLQTGICISNSKLGENHAFVEVSGWIGWQSCEKKKCRGRRRGGTQQQQKEEGDPPEEKKKVKGPKRKSPGQSTRPLNKPKKGGPPPTLSGGDLKRRSLKGDARKTGYWKERGSEVCAWDAG